MVLHTKASGEATPVMVEANMTFNLVRTLWRKTVGRKTLGRKTWMRDSWSKDALFKDCFRKNSQRKIYFAVTRGLKRILKTKTFKKTNN